MRIEYDGNEVKVIWEFTVECAECGTTLGIIYHKNKMTVYPCKNCLEVAWKRGIEQAKEE